MMHDEEMGLEPASVDLGFVSDMGGELTDGPMFSPVQGLRESLMTRFLA